MFQSYGIVSCEVVYGRAPNLSGYTQTADGAVVTPEALPRVTGQIVAGPSSTASGTGNSTEALLREAQKIEQENALLREQQKIEQEKRRMQEIKQRSDMNATLINAGANIIGALISRLGRSTPTQPAETPAPTQSVASQQISNPQPPGYAPQPGYVQQPGYAPQPGYIQQPGYTQASVSTTAPVQAALMQPRQIVPTSEIEARLGLVIDPSCSLSSMIIRLLNGQTICTYPRPPYRPGRYAFNGSSLVPLK